MHKGYTNISAQPGFSDLAELLEKLSESDCITNFCVLCDTNTLEHCLPLIRGEIGHLIDCNLIIIEPGEENKIFNTVNVVIDFLTGYKADRNSILINLGGGVVCDIGGFSASVYKRGIRYVNIPTTFLAQIDASVGGKTGLNHKGIKNHIGTFFYPELVYINPQFLKTLPYDEWLSGYGELFKYFVTGANVDLDSVLPFNKATSDVLIDVISGCINFKLSFVETDPYDTMTRGVLNFGHTFGHALESALFHSEKPITHGEAVAAGILAEAWISSQLTGLSNDKLKSIIKLYHKIFTAGNPIMIEPQNIADLLAHDKKNSSGMITPVLLDASMKPVFNCSVTTSMAADAIKFMISQII